VLLLVYKNVFFGRRVPTAVADMRPEFIRPKQTLLRANVAYAVNIQVSHVYTYTHTHTHTYIYKYICIHMYIYIYK